MKSDQGDAWIAAAQDGEVVALKRQWGRVDALCRYDRDELVRARNCALRQQAERELEHKNFCRTAEDWAPCVTARPSAP